jgi:uncharacterized protein
VVILLGIDYGSLADRGLEFTLILVLVGLLVGFGEEGLFRCIGVTTFRRNGFPEGRVALWSSVVFGLVHVANAIGGSSSAYFQAVVVAFAGYFFYLVRRVSRSNVLNSVLHGGFDFMLLSGTAIIPAGETTYPLSALGVLAYLVCGVLVLVRRRSIEPSGSPVDALSPTPPAHGDGR